MVPNRLKVSGNHYQDVGVWLSNKIIFSLEDASGDQIDFLCARR